MVSLLKDSNGEAAFGYLAFSRLAICSAVAPNKAQAESSRVLNRTSKTVA